MLSANGFIALTEMDLPVFEKLVAPDSSSQRVNEAGALVTSGR
jgi:hypothetical protein